MTLVVRAPATSASEREYIVKTVLGEFLGLDYRLEPDGRADVSIGMDGDDGGKELRMPDVLFQTPPDDWLTAASLPDRPLACWDVSELSPAPLVVSSPLPVIYGRKGGDGEFCRVADDSIDLGIDLLGGALFMLTRYEEIVNRRRDDRDRFPAAESLAFQEGFLDRPVVNEYVEVLWWALKRLWPALSRTSRETRVFLTHDVDRPFRLAGMPCWNVIKESLAHIRDRRDVRSAGRHMTSYLAARAGWLDRDPYYTFDFLMDLSEQHGLRSAFYFMAGKADALIDGDYELEDRKIRELMRKIYDRGHEIGFHPSYHTFRDADATQREFQRLRQACAKLGITQERWGGRQHYLRWENPVTWQNWEDAGLDYDSSLSFADRPGFRCGTCYEFPVFNLLTRQQLRLRERPLVVMETTLLGYLGMTLDEAAQTVCELYGRCRQFHGDFTLLWHNSSLETPQQKDSLREIVRQLA